MKKLLLMFFLLVPSVSAQSLEVWAYSLGSVLLVSLLAFVGLLVLAVKVKTLHKLMLFLVSFSAGALLGDAFLHLLPEIVEEVGFTLTVSLSLLVGMFLFFILEKFIHWNHCHYPTTKEHPHAFAITNLVGDGFHNLLDGLIIGAGYLVSIPVGIATTLAVIFHEIPQELGDFGVLVHGGFSKFKALMYNFLSALVAVFGVVLALLLGGISSFSSYLVPFAAGSFIYIATADLIPELHKETKPLISGLQVVGFVLGVLVMVLLL
tara:strand:+ start:718 stop:1509 length:792 start_codon:yes stop_codon:yes gene_type:complete